MAVVRVFPLVTGTPREPSWCLMVTQWPDFIGVYVVLPMWHVYVRSTLAIERFIIEHEVR